MKKPTIAISGPPGAGSSTIAKLLANRLGLEYFSPGQFFKSLVQKEGDETNQASVSWSSESGKSKSTHSNIDEHQKNLAKQGGYVIDGKLSIQMLKELADLTVWIDADLKVRAERAVKRDKISYEEALQKVFERQTTERFEWHSMYNFDYIKQAGKADLVMDSSSRTPEEIVEIIVQRLANKGNSSHQSLN